MASIPPVLLIKLYVTHSLRNQGDGFTFQLENQIAAGTVTAHLTVDGVARPLDGVTIVTGDETRSALSVPGALSAGEHTREVGALTFPVTDTIS